MPFFVDTILICARLDIENATAADGGFGGRLVLQNSPAMTARAAVELPPAYATQAVIAMAPGRLHQPD